MSEPAFVFGVGHFVVLLFISSASLLFSLTAIVIGLENKRKKTKYLNG